MIELPWVSGNERVRPKPRTLEWTIPNRHIVLENLYTQTIDQTTPPSAKKKERNKLYQTKLYLSIKPGKNSNFCQSRDNDVQKFEEK